MTAAAPSLEPPISRPVDPRPAPPPKPRGTASVGFGVTSRLDPWGVKPVLIALGLTTFVVYALVTAFLLTPVFGIPYEADGYLSPFFSPLIAPTWLPWWFSPAILILWIPLGFRTTCYAFRRAYYRSYFADPPACAVGEPVMHRRYSMEAAFPFILQNLHRFFLYLQFVPLFFLWIDGLTALHPGDSWRFGLGNVILFVDLALLTGYSFSCHSLRHFVGGRLDCFSCTARIRTRGRLWRSLTVLNGYHIPLGAWSLLGVLTADLYIRMLAAGVFVDPAIRF
jgi:hypothetical protein